jgi:hypothetical protein
MTLEDALLLVATALDIEPTRDRALELRRSLETIRHYTPHILTRCSGRLDTGSRHSESGPVRDAICLEGDTVYIETFDGIVWTRAPVRPG